MKKKSSERIVQVSTNSDFVACAQKGADRPAHQCSRDERHMTSDLYTSLIWFKSAQLAEFRYYSFKCFVQRGAMYGFLSALDFLNLIISAFPNFELKILRNWSICSYNVEKMYKNSSSIRTLSRSLKAIESYQLFSHLNTDERPPLCHEELTTS